MKSLHSIKQVVMFEVCLMICAHKIKGVSGRVAKVQKSDGNGTPNNHPSLTVLGTTSILECCTKLQERQREREMEKMEHHLPNQYR